ncbi:hypothetical protein B0T26DRAFT_498802 [Lasiosphaeria miniovina]|uniref:Transmembrane protein n=1 Tax=Lasiosphaeria miniovina TaxID=1954250 RepID=A0AA39ZTT4_9PEZI|nr:uncharacterized protein B0T26DRAFT_498802 [Lasiosphaeria miniovina]KAK0703448.1 hypothetical protein B0T26DRAFT_498802 [Lasiosphaeria miniovina]
MSELDKRGLGKGKKEKVALAHTHTYTHIRTGQRLLLILISLILLIRHPQGRKAIRHVYVYVDVCMYLALTGTPLNFNIGSCRGLRSAVTGGVACTGTFSPAFLFTFFPFHVGTLGDYCGFYLYQYRLLLPLERLRIYVVYLGRYSTRSGSSRSWKEAGESCVTSVEEKRVTKILAPSLRKN